VPGPVFSDGDRVALRTVEDADLPFLRRHWNAPDYRRWFARSDPTTAAGVREALDAEDAVHFLACRGEEPVGFAWLFDVDDVAGRAELGYWVRADAQGEGYATETAELALEYAFDERRLHKVSARVLEGNEPSRRVLEALGFAEEGVLREHYHVDGEYVDATLYATFRER
jgi:RimJ/RimL family protein N-acetyltransferase